MREIIKIMTHGRHQTAVHLHHSYTRAVSETNNVKKIDIT
jgi:hypothetical protein